MDDDQKPPKSQRCVFSKRVILHDCAGWFGLRAHIYVPAGCGLSSVSSHTIGGTYVPFICPEGNAHLFGGSEIIRETKKMVSDTLE